MREIKFRCWNKEHKKMYEQQDPYVIQAVIFGNDYNGVVEVMQYIGLKDKNGKEIYEGDILKLFNDEIGSDIPCNFIGEVEYYESGFFVDNHKDYGCPVFQEIAEWLIIGNIYENPELLNI